MSMPTELKLAKPQIATEIMARPFGVTMGTELEVKFLKANKFIDG
jgi:hypothetical protein